MAGAVLPDLCRRVDETVALALWGLPIAVLGVIVDPLVAVAIFWGLLAVGLAWALRGRAGESAAAGVAAVEG